MKKHILLTLGLAAFVCASQAQEKLAESIKATRAEATGTYQQLDTSLNALNALVQQKSGDLRPAYNNFQSEVPKTEIAAATTKSRAEAMTKDSGTYFADWQKTIDGIENKSLQKKAQKRMKAAMKSYTKVTEELRDAAEKFRPFLSDLNDVKKTLVNDVTADGVKSVKSTVRSANWNYKAVAGAINDALDEMKKMEKALSASAS
ncbi:MAG TPA: DUF2959 family protein [Candidatus Dormibacteraeota bacterium]|nr:DUF2959 family protein [Candidatus Dormibacteraeota bacterium]